MSLGLSNVSPIHFGFGFIVNPDPIIEKRLRQSGMARVNVESVCFTCHPRV